MRIEQYYLRLRQLLELQRGLISVLEATVEVEPLSPNRVSRLGDEFQNLIRPEFTLSQILRNWPDHLPLISFLIWVRPRKGILSFKGESWLFDVHGVSQVGFHKLPKSLGKDALEHIRHGDRDCLLGAPGGGPSVQTRYRRTTVVDHVSVWSVYVSAAAIDVELSRLSELNHEYFLNELTRKGFLTRSYRSDGKYFVFTDR